MSGDAGDPDERALYLTLDAQPLAPGAARSPLRPSDESRDVDLGPGHHPQDADLRIALGASQETDRMAALVQ